MNVKTIEDGSRLDYDDGLLHGVHLACQSSSVYKTGCGIWVSDDDQVPLGDDQLKCVVCWSREVCDDCGKKLADR